MRREGDQAASALRESEARFHAVMDLVPDPMLRVDTDGSADWFNGRWSAYTGQALSAAQGKGWLAAVHDEDQPVLQAYWRHAAKSRRLLPVELRLRRHDGDWRWHLVRAVPSEESGEGGRGLRWFCAASDVHEQHIARELLERRMQQRMVELRTVLDSAASAVLATDLRGRVTMLNPAAERLLGLPAAQLLGRRVLSLVTRDRLRTRLQGLPPEIRQALWPGLPQAGGPASEPVSEWEGVRNDGSRFPVLVGLSLLPDEQGQPRGLLAVVTDLTERKAMEEQLHQRTRQAEAASCAKSMFLAHMSHEIRTPLNAVIGLAQLLRQMELPDRAQDFVRHIHQAGEQLLALTNDVLDFSRVEAGQMPLEAVAFGTASLVQAVGAIVRPQAQAKGLQFDVQVDPALPAQLVGDPLRLRQILLNLLGNALKFTQAGTITLRVHLLAQDSASARLRLEVQDTGIGIEPQQQGRIFEPFTQGDSTTTRRFGGTGLGLSIVRRLVALMEGRLELHSVPGAGSTFSVTLTLPLAPPPPPPGLGHAGCSGAGH